ncbi:AraC family transcriptional regulator [Aestuariicella hydrocarbonica]|uniref:AraC family transcriptional regulator n=1 Tax=Pseudomaricurvus hydrocarbonicus TaxID=1470433 RepID=A0A9E5MNE7_9GAMM|nr:AraC family transcriptional regulator [Aestuariicella hydrocarbonica]NHO67481.1 AraC family transcriptional regulator [Aestuariicella hydrocarbonica]
MTYLMRSGSLEGYLELMEQLDVDADPLLRQAGLKKWIFNNPNTMISYQAASHLLELSAAHTRTPHFGLLMAFRRRGLVMGLFGLLCRQCPDVATAINQAIRNLHLHNQLASMEPRVGDTEVLIVRHLRDQRLEKGTQMRQMALGDVCRFLNSLTPEAFKLKRVYFSLSAPVDTQIYKQMFKTEVLFEQEFDALSFDRSLMNQKLPAQDQDVQKHLEHYLQVMKNDLYDDIAKQTKHLIEQTITSPECNINNIARLLAMHKRTLQKKLTERDTSFSDLLDEVRWSKARQTLENSNIPLSRLASLLGYSELSAFSRAFKTEFGLSPKQWRQAHQDNRTEWALPQSPQELS